MKRIFLLLIFINLTACFKLGSGSRIKLINNTNSIQVDFEKIGNQDFIFGELEVFSLNFIIKDEDLTEIKIKAGNVMIKNREDENNPRSIYINNRNEFKVKLYIDKRETKINLGLYQGSEFKEDVSLKIIRV